VIAGMKIHHCVGWGMAAVVLAGSVARAADVSALMAEAMEQNPELAAARSRWERARQQAPQARSLEDPLIGANVERSGTRDFSDYTDIEWSASQRIPWFGKRGAAIRAAEWEAEAAGFRYLETLRQVRADVITAAWELWRIQQALAVNAEQTDLLRRFEAVARARYESGDGAQRDILRAGIELSRMTNETDTLRRELLVAQTALNKALGAPAETSRRPGELDPLPALEDSVEPYLRRARDFCCVLISFDRLVKARRADLRTARLASAPDIEFRVEARQFDGGHSIEEYDTGVFLNFPWLWRGKYRGQVRAAEAALAEAEAELRTEINMTEFEAHEWYTRAEKAIRDLALLEQEVIPPSGQLVEATQAEYQTGRASFFELLDAQRALLDARRESYEARAHAGSALARLDQITGPYGEPEIATGLVTATGPVSTE
jgi:cobalt-zinc-cadmium efflux system outer membrane protein